MAPKSFTTSMRAHHGVTVGLVICWLGRCYRELSTASLDQLAVGTYLRRDDYTGLTDVV